MKQKIALLLAGVLVGSFLMAVIPAAAHHQPAFRRLKNRVASLETKVNRIQTRVNNRTQQLDANGDYFGFVIGEQVLSLCQAEAVAEWQDSGETVLDMPIAWLDTCFPEGSTRASQRQLRRQGR